MNTETNRQEFEEWATSNESIGLDLDIDKNTNHYCDISTYAAWEAWQAARERQDKIMGIIATIRKADCGRWLKPNADGSPFRMKLMRCLDDLYKEANTPTSEKI